MDHVEHPCYVVISSKRGCKKQYTSVPFSQGHTFLQLFPILWPYKCITVRWYCIMGHTPIPPREDLLKSCCTRRKNCGSLQLEVCPCLGGVKQSRNWPHLEAINILLYNSLSGRWDWIKNPSLVLKADSKIVQLDRWEWSCYYFPSSLIFKSVPRAVASLSLPGGQDQNISSYLSSFLEHCLIFPQFCFHFLPHFGLLGGWVAHPGMPWLRHCLFLYSRDHMGSMLYRLLALLENFVWHGATV